MNKARKTKIIYKIRTTDMDFSLNKIFFFFYNQVVPNLQYVSGQTGL